MRSRGPGQARIVQQTGVKRRHAHHRGGLRQQVDDLVGIKPGQENHRPARQQGHIGGDKQPMGVKDRQGVQQHIIRSKAPSLHQHLCVRQQIALGQHRPLGPACRARRVQDGGQIIPVTADRGETVWLPLGQIDQRAGAIRIQRLQLRPVPGGHFGQRRGLGGAGDQQGRTRIADEIVHLGGGIGRVQRQKHQPGLHAGGINRQSIDGFFGLQSDTVAGGQAQTRHCMGHTAGAVDKGGVSQRRPAATLQKHGSCACIPAKQRVIQRVRHRCGHAITCQRTRRANPSRWPKPSPATAPSSLWN